MTRFYAHPDEIELIMKSIDYKEGSFFFMIENGFWQTSYTIINCVQYNKYEVDDQELVSAFTLNYQEFLNLSYWGKICQF